MTLPASDASLSQAIALHRAGKFAEAEAMYRALLAANPNHANVLNLLGTANFQRGNHEEGLRLMERAVAIKPDYTDAYADYGVALLQVGRYEDALANFKKAFALKPHHTAILNLLGKAHFYCGHREEGVRLLEQATLAHSNNVDAHYDHGVALLQLGRYEEALASFERAITLSPAYAEAQWNKALVKLLLGDYEGGWKLYEWRWKRQVRKEVRAFDKPLWLGSEAIANKTILLHAEQGLGDAIQFCRYAPMLEALGARVLIEVPASLVELFSTLKGSPKIIIRGDPLPAFDMHCPMPSLPLALGTRLDTIPADIPCLLVDMHRRKQWQDKLGQKTRPRIGLVWSGSATNENDRNRSIAFGLLAPLLSLDFEFHSLQKDIRPQDEVALKQHSHIISHAEDLHDFADTAALTDAMDLVISVDTSVAHLAGALGKRVWILLPFLPDFRWMTGREDSPWYPTARLFRQPVIGDWGSVVAAVQKEMDGIRLK